MTKSRNQETGTWNLQAELTKRLLREALPPVGDEPESPRDLWPAMLQRMGEQSIRVAGRVPWFDWALAGGLVAFTAIAPRTIPVILYYL